MNGTVETTWSVITLNHVLLTGAESALVLTEVGGSTSDATHAAVAIGFPVWFD